MKFEKLEQGKVNEVESKVLKNWKKKKKEAIHV